MSDRPSPATRWSVVLLSVAAGMAGACLIGKVPPALPTLRADLGLDLVEAGWLASLMSLLGATCGIAVGTAVDHLGRRRAILAALGVMAAGSLLGGLAATPVALFAARLVESIGFVAAVVAAPSIITEVTEPKDRRFVFGLWGSYIPTGIAFAMVATPHGLAAFGWPGVSLAGALLALAVALALGLAFRRVPDQAVEARGLKDLGAALKARGAWVLGAAFSFYAFQWFIVMTWLPTLLIETLGFDAAAAGLATASVVLVNAFGNLMGGLLLARGARGWALIAAVALIQGTTVQAAFAESLPEALRFAAVLAFSLFGGMLPASVFATLPQFAARPALIGLLNGLIVQCSNFGGVLGPPVYAATVLWLGGWDKGALVMLAASAGVLVLAAVLRPLERK